MVPGARHGDEAVTARNGVLMTFKTGLAVVNRPKASGYSLRLLKDCAVRIMAGLIDESICQVVESSRSLAGRAPRRRNANEQKKNHNAEKKNQE